ncbi:SHOCT domain-containing protein [Cumulibacter soli]|uniref:SHOCT domain-containing protein n=1 Tax=Cumulibacter soli TaxID=2546344 RepID=UPI001067DD28|nr:SHOCT domain-containing protein [Cumulibacter soli]
MFGRGIGRVGRPGLLGTMARTAVVAGTASAVSGSVARHQQERAMEQQQANAYREQQAYTPPPPATPAASGTDDVIAQLKELGELRSSGVLTEEEFAAQKAKLLGT